MKVLQDIFIYCFDKWWRPLFFFGFIFFLLIINSDLNIHFLKGPLDVLSDFSLIILLISIFYQLYKHRFLKGCVTTIVGVVAVVISMMIVLIDGDHWADGLEIPANIQIDDPIDTDRHKRPDSIYVRNTNKPDLVLYNGFQPGMYQYDFLIRKIERGSIYLKAFEITQEEQLSKDNLKEDSKIPIGNPSDSIIRFRSSGDFTIYEGDWGKFYAARFEVWFIPDSGGKERNLFQKNFKIEGWMH